MLFKYIMPRHGDTNKDCLFAYQNHEFFDNARNKVNNVNLTKQVRVFI